MRDAEQFNETDLCRWSLLVSLRCVEPLNMSDLGVIFSHQSTLFCSKMRYCSKCSSIQKTMLYDINDQLATNIIGLSGMVLIYTVNCQTLHCDRI